MLRFCTLLLTTAVLASCSNDVDLSQISKRTKRVEVLQFDGKGDMVKQKELSDEEAIQKIFSVVGTSEAPEVTCPFDFEIRCFDQSNKIIFLVELNSQELCNNAVFVYQDQMYHRYLNEGSVETLRTLLN